MNKVGKTARPFRYDLNQIPYDYTVDVRNRFKGLDLIDRVPDELWTEVRDTVQETMPKPLTVWLTTNWKIFQEIGIPDHLTCLLRNLYAGQEATVRTEHGTTDWYQIGKGVRQGCILSSCLFNLYAEYIMRNARLDEAQASWNQDCQEKNQ